MNAIIQYFNHVPDSHRVAVLFFAIFFTWNFENILAFHFNYSKWKHAFTNASFMLWDAPVQLLLGFLFNLLLVWNENHPFGIINHLGIQNPVLLFIISFLLLDFFEYVYHVIMHKFHAFWLFHLVHHSDQNLDVSTTLREHPIETSIRLSFTLLWVFLSGVSFWMLMARQFIQIISNVTAHANLRLSERNDNFLSYFLVTPNMHQVHHHYVLPYTDSNYGDVLSIWDRLFGTFRKMKYEDLVFGVDKEMDKEKLKEFSCLLSMPFRVGKNYAQKEFDSDYIISSVQELK
ncbi:sterol desaturase family protein [Emticicia sp. SJ17W-69]|uniref:sterol desaturase family protein n=1 Tax=Emticicia sp. SJ17W-69 TaxID=3421657 RepID=UPI003EBC50DA